MVSKKILLIGLAIVGVIVVASVYVTNERKVAQQHRATSNDWSLLARAITPEDHIIGDASAPIQIIVYSDFACKYCKSLFGTNIPKLQTLYPNKLVIAFRHFPLASQTGTQEEAEAAECIYNAKGNEAFWTFANAMFETQGVKGDMRKLLAHAQKVGVDPVTFSACMDTHEGAARVAKDQLEASIAGIGTTPSEILKSKNRALIVKGDYFSQLDTAIQYLLQSEELITSLK